MVRSRSYFSIPYLCGAAHYAREALALETKTPDADTPLIHRAYVICAVTSSAAALEAMINEAFADASESEGSCIAGLSTDARSKLAALWAIPKTSNYSIIDKYDVVHLLVTGERLDRSHHRWGNATSVVRLRNVFVHFEPSWRQHGIHASNEQKRTIEVSLKGLFPENQLAGPATPFFPDRLLGYGCAAWALASAIEFADHFWENLGLNPPYQGYRHLLAM